MHSRSDFTNMHDYKGTSRPRSAQLHKKFQVPSMAPTGSKTRQSNRLAIPDAVKDHVPAATRTALNVTPEVPLEVHNSKEKEEPAIDADPESSDDDEPSASADIPQTTFVRTPEKETKTKVLGIMKSGIRGNRNGRLATEPPESPDAQKAREWEEENKRIGRRKKRGREIKQRLDRSKPFSSRISAASANIHAVETKKSSLKGQVLTKPATPKKKKSGLNIPGEISITASPRSASKRTLRIPGILPTPATTQSSPSPSPKKKRRFEEEYGSDRDGKKPKRDSDISFGPSSPTSLAPEEFDEGEGETQCNICFQEVDRTLAEMYLWPTSRPTMQEKNRFCTWHKTKEAEKTWNEQGYPTINWTKLKERLSDYDAELERLINDPETSHYRQVLKDKTKGKMYSLARLQQDENADLDLELGFYGYRGLDMMTNYITTTFHDLLRKKSAGDHVISSSARGVVHYARLVLAKELAALLIRDEMEVSLERARDILIESASVGEALNGKEVHVETGASEKSKASGRVYVGWDGNEIEATQC